MSKTPAACFDLWTSEVHKFSAFRTLFLPEPKTQLFSKSYVLSFKKSKQTYTKAICHIVQPTQQRQMKPITNKGISFFFFFSSLLWVILIWLNFVTCSLSHTLYTHSFEILFSKHKLQSPVMYDLIGLTSIHDRLR